MNPFRKLFQLSVQLDAVLCGQRRILEKLEKIMSDISDLQAAVAQLGADVSAEIAAITAVLSGPNPDIQAVTAQLNTLDATVKAETAALAPPAPAPAA